MNWYYADGNQQLGPISETELDGLYASGRITGATLIWREGMQTWQPYSQARQGAAAPVDVAGGFVVCSQCGQSVGADEVIRYGETPVCANCKPAFVQRLKEGAAMPHSFELATVGARFGAKFLDNIILFVASLPIGFVVGMAGGGAGMSEVAIQVIAQLGGFVVNLIYVVFFLGKFGATPGKMALKIKVVSAEGEPITYGRAAGRYFAEILSSLICGIGYLMALFDEEKRTLHDRLCNTRVIKA